MASYILLAVVKILDSMLSTGKSILTQKNKALAASSMIVVSQFLFYMVISQVVKENNIISTIIVSIGGGIGSYLVFFINNRFSKDKLYTNVVTTTNTDAMKELGDFCRDNDIGIITHKSYDYDINETLTAQIFCHTKNESKKVDEFIDNSDIKYFRKVIH